MSKKTTGNRPRGRHQPTIWTPTARTLLYEMLVAKYGPHKTWAKRGSPGKGLDDDFKKFCDNFAKLVGSKSRNGVQNQIRWSFPPRDVSPHARPHARSSGHCLAAILNMAAALNTGFVESSALHQMKIVGTERKVSNATHANHHRG